MPIVFKIDVLEALRVAGYTTYRIRQDNLLPASTVQKLRKGEPLSWASLQRLCELLSCQPGDLLEYVPDRAD